VVGLNDIYATVCDLAGISKPKEGSAVDSISFANYIASGNSWDAERKSLGTFSLKGRAKWNHALHKGKWKLVQFPHNNTMELYDMENDFGETHNKVLDYARIASRMCKELREIGPCPLNGTKFKSECEKNGFSYDEKLYCKVPENVLLV